MFEAIISRSNQTVFGKRPDSYLSNLMYPAIGALQGEFEIRHEDICAFHQAIYARLNENSVHLDEAIYKWKQTKPNEPWDEETEYRQSQILSGFHAKESLLNSMKSFADETTSIGLWALVEQFSSRSFANVCSNPETIKKSYAWDKQIKNYLSLGIAVESCREFSEINELRVLNNKIKHLNTVDAELAAYPHYSKFEGARFNRVLLPMQKYADAVYLFLGDLMEKVGELKQPV